MSKKVIYRIRVLNWEAHNSSHKRSYKKFMMANNFWQDAKLRSVSMHTRWLFLTLLGVCSDMARDSVELSSNMLRDVLECNRNIDGTLDSLQSLQLLTWEKLPLIEENRRELKRTEEKRSSPEGGSRSRKKSIKTENSLHLKDASPPVADEPVGKILVGLYCDAWKERYGGTVSIRPQDAKALKAVGEANGLEKTKVLLRAYLQINDTWFVKKRHDLQTFQNNLAIVSDFVENGRVISNQDLRSMDRSVGNRNTLELLKEGKI